MWVHERAGREKGHRQIEPEGDTISSGGAPVYIITREYESIHMSNPAARSTIDEVI
jgi:hypothetical protein